MQDKHNHINGIENFWNHAKRTLSRYNGIPRHHFVLFLKEAEFRFNYGSPSDQLRQIKRLGGAGHVRTIAAWSSVAARAGALKAAARRCAVAPQSGGASLDRTCARSPWCLWPGRRKRRSNQTKKLVAPHRLPRLPQPKRVGPRARLHRRIWDSPKTFNNFQTPHVTA